jgi:hypothetical protein
MERDVNRSLTDDAIDAFRPLDPDNVYSYLHKAVDFIVDYF